MCYESIPKQDQSIWENEWICEKNFLCVQDIMVNLTKSIAYLNNITQSI